MHIHSYIPPTVAASVAYAAGLNASGWGSGPTDTGQPDDRESLLAAIEALQERCDGLSEVCAGWEVAYAEMVDRPLDMDDYA